MLSFGERLLGFCLILLQCGNLTQLWLAVFMGEIMPPPSPPRLSGCSWPGVFTSCFLRCQPYIVLL